MAEQQTPSAENQSSSTTPVSLTLLDPDVLECPICCEPLKIPIFQCENGHLACSQCCEKVKKICPSCKSPNGYSRCRAMERVIEACRVSCPNSKYGCKENTSFGNRSSHEKQCLFAPCFCPVPLNDCNYVGSDKNLRNHIRAKHKDHVIPIVFDTPLTLVMGSSEKIVCFQEKKDGELFVVQAFRKSYGLSVSVNCIAPSAHGHGRFSCCMDVIIDPCIKLKQAFTVREIQKKIHEEPKDSFMLIPSHMLMLTDWSFGIDICFSRGMDSFIRA
ncbi:E3 ubiquitin-protein ligase SINA-like 10 [Brassica rapa]|uniref:RING-type E3 ubiquitin transferase n=1 Tax=Brassica campestris TaxID=3711 RepID=M4D794_BRACM|nr:E3 ubiquitin-protein ligase SINA-like 10 [Brassica rapa]